MGDVSVLDRLRRIEFGAPPSHQLAAKTAKAKSSASKDLEAKAYVGQFVTEVKRFHAANKELRTKACAEIGHLTYHGGESVQSYLLTDDRLIQTMLSVIANRSEIIALRKQVVQTLQVIVHCARVNVLEEVLMKNHANVTLANTINDDNEEMRTWIAHTLFCLTVRCLPESLESLNNEGFRRNLRRAATDNWLTWKYNDAEELMKVLNMPYHPSEVSGCLNGASADNERRALSDDELEQMRSCELSPALSSDSGSGSGGAGLARAKVFSLLESAKRKASALSCGSSGPSAKE